MITTILGIDPGLATTGYGAIENIDDELKMQGCGVVSTPAETEFCQRLQIIHNSTLELASRFQPDVISVEELFFCKNVKTAIKVGQARGVILLGAGETEAKLTEYSPLQVKKTITGNGNADKKAVQKMVKNELGLSEVPRPDDAADALAIAICHVILNRYRSKLPAEQK
ncbi:MAG: crossover junction endodeoxyribonuclease RuvC [bacterium]